MRGQVPAPIRSDSSPAPKSVCPTAMFFPSLHRRMARRHSLHGPSPCTSSHPTNCPCMVHARPRHSHAKLCSSVASCLPPCSENKSSHELLRTGFSSLAWCVWVRIPKLHVPGSKASKERKKPEPMHGLHAFKRTCAPQRGCLHKLLWFCVFFCSLHFSLLLCPKLTTQVQDFRKLNLEVLNSQQLLSPSYSAKPNTHGEIPSSRDPCPCSSCSPTIFLTVQDSLRTVLLTSCLGHTFKVSLCHVQQNRWWSFMDSKANLW